VERKVIRKDLRRYLGHRPVGWAARRPGSSSWNAAKPSFGADILIDVRPMRAMSRLLTALVTGIETALPDSLFQPPEDYRRRNLSYALMVPQ
jgi:hypothetical protein